MSRQDANANFALTSFLDGANATYIDQLYARYENDPSSVDPDWVDFFKTLKDQPADVAKSMGEQIWPRSQPPRSWSKDEAPENMRLTSVALDILQAPRLSLNVFLSWNRPEKSSA